MEISTDQNTIKLEFEFVETDNKIHPCSTCFFKVDKCKDNYPCRNYNRKDKKNGYFKLKEK